MFGHMIEALVYVIIAGTPMEDPHRFLSKQTFDTIDACQTYMKSDAMAEQRAALAKNVAAEVNNPDAVLAVTSSCVADDRI